MNLRGVVTIEATARFSGDEYRLLLGAIRKAFAKTNVETRVGPEFAEQVGWLRRNFDYLCRSPIKNHFRVIVDEKHSHVTLTAPVAMTTISVSARL